MVSSEDHCRGTFDRWLRRPLPPGQPCGDLIEPGEGTGRTQDLRCPLSHCIGSGFVSARKVSQQLVETRGAIHRQ